MVINIILTDLFDNEKTTVDREREVELIGRICLNEIGRSKHKSI